MRKAFEQKLDQLSIEMNDTAHQQFEEYYQQLVEWNKVMNLTAITDMDQVIEKHFVDSLSIINAIDLQSTHSLIDVGTGAGFPGIPIKIAFPHVNIVLLDSLNKRVTFLEYLIQKLDLDNIQAIHSRAEDAAKRADLRESFDISTSRAVANLSTLSEYCIPFTKKGGVFISYKSGNIDEELEQSKKAINILGGSIENHIKFQLPDSEINRSFIVIRKNKSTDRKYPRKAGLPGRDPL